MGLPHKRHDLMLTRRSDALIPSAPCLTLRECITGPYREPPWYRAFGVDALASSVTSPLRSPARSDLIGRQIHDESRLFY
jgi:hypothetical protein